MKENILIDTTRGTREALAQRGDWNSIRLEKINRVEDLLRNVRGELVDRLVIRWAPNSQRVPLQLGHGPDEINDHVQEFLA